MPGRQLAAEIGHALRGRSAERFDPRGMRCRPRRAADRPLRSHVGPPAIVELRHEVQIGEARRVAEAKGRRRWPAAATFPRAPASASVAQCRYQAPIAASAWRIVLARYLRTRLLLIGWRSQAISWLKLRTVARAIGSAGSSDGAGCSSSMQFEDRRGLCDELTVDLERRHQPLRIDAAGTRPSASDRVETYS